MEKVVINKSTLTSIGDAIRAKDGSTELIAPLDMPAAIEAIKGGSDPVIEELSVTANGTYNAPTGIDGYSPVVVNVPQDGALTEEELTFQGIQNRTFSGGNWDWFVNKYGNQMQMKNITSLQYCFEQSKLNNIPFIIYGVGEKQGVDMTAAFSRMEHLINVPDVRDCRIVEMSYLFSGDYRIREIPVSFIENNIFTSYKNSTTAYSMASSYIFQNCYSLRKIPAEFFNVYNSFSANSYSYYYSGFSNCRVLDELINLPCYESATWNSNAFSNSFQRTNRLSRIVFATNEDGTAKISKWKSQTIDLSMYVGYASSASDITSYSSIHNITIDKQVSDDATYQALKNDPDMFASKIHYSRYNHDSAVETINSLPDTSAYLASGGTNTIKFASNSGISTDAGGIGTLTDAEIAVAAAKGWTITLV